MSKSFYNNYIKRALDVVISLIGLPFFVFLIIPISILIKIEDGGPVFYCAKRLGKNGIYFRMYKFRSMKANSPDLRLSDGSTYNAEDDPRLTRIGKFLRVSSLDEMPQIINVLIGSMSLIGPRPDININRMYPEKSFAKLRVKPGITGYNQAYFRNQNDWLEKLENDNFYIEKLSFLFDLKIFIRSFYVVLKRENTFKPKTNAVNSLGEEKIL